MAHASIHDPVGYLAGRRLTPASAAVLRVVVLLVKWEERRRTRIALSRLDAPLLRDIGLTSEQARREVERPFWQS